MSRSGCRKAIVAALLLGAASVASAQTLRGKAAQPSGGAGIAGVLVLLVDSTGIVVARALTNEHGEYRVTAPGAGAYRVRTLRIGYHPAISDPVELRAGTELLWQVTLANLPFALDTVRVLAKARCSPYDGSSSIASVWEQVRTALTAADLTTRDRVLYATVVRQRRVLDAQSGRVREESSTPTSGFASRPWGTVPTDSLRRFGYVYRLRDGSTRYYAPDIDALLSEVFIQDHCFRFASGPDSALLGVAFEPTGDRRNIPEIAGTVWLDRKSAELRRMEFGYVNLPRPRYRLATGTANATGQMDFVRMMNGGWAISNWELRLPVLKQRPRTGASSYEESTEMHVSELIVQAGVLTLVRRGQDTLWRAR